MRLLQVALAAALFWGILLVTGLACYGGEPLKKGDVVASAAFCRSIDVAHEVAEILIRSRDKNDAGVKLMPFFNGQRAPCFIFPGPVPIIVEDVIGAGIDIEGDTFFIVQFTPPDTRPLYFFFFDLPGLRRDMAL